MSVPDVHPSIFSGYGLIEAPFDRVVETFGTHRRADQSAMSVTAPRVSAAEALEYLAVRTHPATRLVLLDLGDWTAVLTNHRNGSDFADHQHWAARSRPARSIRVVDSEARWWRAGDRRERLAWDARIFDFHAADDSVIRTIECTHDGDRWSFSTSGEPLPVEVDAPYEGARTRDRFTRQQLRDLLVALGPGPVTADRIQRTERFALLSERIANEAWRKRVDDWACTLAECDDPAFGYFMLGMTSYVPHIRTHASSVIHCFENAVAINPDYEPRVRAYLQEARQIAQQTAEDGA